VFAECPEPTTNELMPLNHWFSMTINCHPKKYTYQNLHITTTNVKDARRKSHLSTTKLNGIHLAFPYHFQVYFAAVASADNIAINKSPLFISPTKEDSTSDPDPNI
jgi:hypothetical protein